MFCSAFIHKHVMALPARYVQREVRIV